MVLTGRLKDIIIRKGENISAKEIEDLLYAHPQVGDVAVIGLPDRERGERVCAVVEAPPGADATRRSTRWSPTCADAGLIRFRRSPSSSRWSSALPRNETLRKVLKYQLRERFAEVPWP